ncbi:hypothetical protein K431DRAFT_320885 [Polychaeton citri CBS 116435]|uniref:Succinate dehydrogenase assembly factor 4, mitochondrial n=1 Tax=Polychaeton citri CBS 116435 TaxID=1314669 RepID=A0A9P4ULZ0_9PEZI|nr:hypothetical protein K431DRAFT_320885 [Polychaeton citri CBS 116435]
MLTTTFVRTVRTIRITTSTINPSRAFSRDLQAKSSWNPQPAPPRLPKEEQEIFERLQQESTGAFSTPLPEREAAFKGSELGSASSSSNEADKMLEMLRERARVAAKGDGEELHPNVRRGAAPEFEGDTNPKTGEVGGPKNDPMKWGATGDWSYNGRVTDF